MAAAVLIGTLAILGVAVLGADGVVQLDPGEACFARPVVRAQPPASHTGIPSRDPSSAPAPDPFRASESASVVAAVRHVDDGPRVAPRPGSEAAFLADFLAAARAPGADPLALADRELQAERPLGARLAALRGLVELNQPGLVERLMTVLRSEPACNSPPELRAFALRALCDRVPTDAAARAALYESLAGPAGHGTLREGERNRAAAALAAAAPQAELLALAGCLHAESDATLLAGVRAALAANPEASAVIEAFPDVPPPAPVQAGEVSE